ncbi:ribosomal protein S18-alanine N-acetyltransferase [Syntrophothermus lipocalidus]|uniref:[Ribosomal protein bS18]-alanine N-acetyltransferase n=1 Tax=Syntrophothermus lipocalidus (strain DSM 12680 / TGB-C1) TaxID=643648 RepID=D7CKV9_SYNLT|nr:ribosomal protein S18-alanine N-acetyltransferase [Syntrophothermus lipocalidus]ADI01344.1 ribosomal-protein-alanine acetyltransferase [Syntrophothermus lipocalidus DSM 12680]HOV43190.1 ribosomal protein S18-alanine N-acetyltransferase [Syntrophothermus lipocalidus]
MEIRKMEPEDLDQVMSIEEVSFPTPWSRESYEGEMQNRLAHYIVGDHEGQVVGYAGIWLIIDEGHITNVAVHPDWRGQGVGEILLNALIALAMIRGVQRMTLEVRPSNLPALRLYRKLNFLPIGLRRQYYSDTGEDAIVMEKLLLPDGFV